MPPTFAAASITSVGFTDAMKSKVASRSKRSTTLRFTGITSWPAATYARTIAEPARPVPPATTIVIEGSLSSLTL